MSTVARDEIFDSSVWLLALCPLLAVSDTVVKALGMSAVVVLMVSGATLLVSLIRRKLDEHVVLAASLLITAGLVACAQLLMRAWFHDLGESFGVFLPLLAVNIALVDHVRELHDEPGTAIRRSVVLALGMAAALLVLGATRELVGRGSLLHGAGALLAGWVEPAEVKVFSVDMGFLLAMLPPGAFIALGLLLALCNWLARRRLPSASTLSSSRPLSLRPS